MYKKEDVFFEDCAKDCYFTYLEEGTAQLLIKNKADYFPQNQSAIFVPANQFIFEFTKKWQSKSVNPLALVVSYPDLTKYSLLSKNFELINPLPFSHILEIEKLIKVGDNYTLGVNLIKYLKL